MLQRLAERQLQQRYWACWKVHWKLCWQLAKSAGVGGGTSYADGEAAAELLE